MIIFFPFLTDTAAVLVVEWHLEELGRRGERGEGACPCSKPGFPAGLRGGVTVLGSGISEQEMRSLLSATSG